MEVEEQGNQERQPYKSQSPVSKAVSSPQAVEGGRSLLSPSPGPHKEEVLQKRFHNRIDRHEAYVQEERKRKAEHRDIKVSQVRGPTLEEAAQLFRREEEEKKQEASCPSTVQVESSPFPEAPTSTATTTDEATGDVSEMEL